MTEEDKILELLYGHCRGAAKESLGRGASAKEQFTYDGNEQLFFDELDEDVCDEIRSEIWDPTYTSTGMTGIDDVSVYADKQDGYYKGCAVVIEVEGEFGDIYGVAVAAQAITEIVSAYLEEKSLSSLDFFIEVAVTSSSYVSPEEYEDEDFEYGHQEAEIDALYTAEEILKKGEAAVPFSGDSPSELLQREKEEQAAAFARKSDAQGKQELQDFLNSICIIAEGERFAKEHINQSKIDYQCRCKECYFTALTEDTAKFVWLTQDNARYGEEVLDELMRCLPFAAKAYGYKKPFKITTIVESRDGPKYGSYTHRISFDGKRVDMIG